MEAVRTALIRLIALWLLCAGLAAAAEIQRIGVLAYRGREAAVADWSGHIDYLNRHLAPLRFELAPMTWSELSEAARQRRIQFVITNSGHYIEMYLAGTANRIATRQMAGPAGPLDRFGGVAIARAGRPAPANYAEMRGKRLLIPDFSSLGGWQVHLGEGLEQGIDLRIDTASIIETRNHEKVVFGILAGEADVGFVRTDLLERMAAEGRILLGDLAIVNPRRENGFPYRLSTRLYAEWPIARIEGTPDDVTRKVLTALLDMSPDDPAARAAGLHGWTVPLTYQPINDLFYRARIGPYAHLPITLRDIYARYGTPLAIAAGSITLIVSLALFYALTANRRLRRTQGELAAREEEFRTLVTNIPGAVYRCALDRDWTVHYISAAVAGLTGYPAEDFMSRRRNYADLILDEDRDRVAREVETAIAAERPYVLEYRIRDATGQVRWILEHGRAQIDPDGGVRWLDGVLLDVSAARLADEKTRQAAAVFEHSAEGIVVADARRRIRTVNPAFIEISGYSEAELHGRDLAFLRAGRRDDDFYAGLCREVELRGSWQGEIWSRRKDGGVYPCWQTLSALRDPEGRVTGYLALYSDITHLKQSEERLQWLAYHDPLTGLANRILFGERLGHAVEQARRHGERLAVLYFDLDGFKGVNDRLGHQVGDELLVAISRRLGTRLRKSDTLSRRGGDEFTLLMENLGDASEAVTLAEDILQQMAKPFLLPCGEKITSGCSIGIALFPDDSEDAEELLRCADGAMYVAKQEGGGHCRLFAAGTGVPPARGA